MENIHTKELLAKLSSIISDNDEDEDTDGEYNDEGIKYSFVEEGDWIDDGKYSYREDVFFFPDHNVYINVSRSRSGSYYSDYYYNDPEYCFVEPKTKTVVTTYYSAIKAV